MKSTEALHEIIAASKWSKEKVATIERDLRALEIIKKYYDIKVNGSGIQITYKESSPMGGIEPKEIEEIKGWLKNGNS